MLVSRSGFFETFKACAAGSEGIIRGVSANASEISYVARFASLARVVAEQNLIAARA